MTNTSKLQIFIILIAFLLVSCKEDTNPVPYRSVNITLYSIEADAEYKNVLAPYNGVVLHDNYDCYGYLCNGILLYRVSNNGGIDDFVAFDMTCPYEVNSCIMEWSASDPYYAKCSCCGSAYNIVGGYLEKGPSEFAPRKYTCEFLDGNVYIH